MEFDLTSSQKIFYTEKIDNSIWTQGALQIFPHIYSYRELNDAFNSLVENNDGLLMYIEKTSNGPKAILKDYQYTDYPFVSFETYEELYAYLKECLNKPISLFDRLVECVVFKAADSSGIIVNSHHIAVDGYSGYVMANYINNYLKASDSFSKETESYVNFIEKKTKYRQSKRFISDKNFWLEQFSGKPETKIFENNKNHNYIAGEYDYEINDELFGKIKKFCATKGSSVSTFFNVLYALYIYKKYNISNFTMGVPVLNRTTKMELNTIGLYMHIVPLVIRIEQNLSFSELFERLENSQINLFRHQMFSQYDIKESLKENGLAYDQLFDMIADYEEFNLNEEYSLKLHYSDAVSVPLEIHLFNNNVAQNLKLRYRVSMFSEDEIKNIVSSIISIAEDVLVNPDKVITELNMMSEEEKHKLLNVFNNTKHSYDIPEESTLYSLFEKTSRENSGKVCLKAGGKEVKFGEFLGISEKLDTEIRNITKGKKSVVAVIAERSVEMYSAIYGIIRGGNAYLPIDPDYPQERIDFILENSDAAAVVAQGKFVSKAGATPCIDMTEFLEVDKSYDVIPACAANENDTAYVIYTSGSTGNPKGAKVSHKSAVNRILWMHDKYPLNSEDVILQKTPYTFDVSVWELFWWGICGVSLTVSAPGEHFLPAKILEETEKNKVTHLHFVPSVFELFLNYLEAHCDELSKFSSVKYVFVSGEALKASSVQRFYKLFDYDKSTLHNLYGPTECAVDVTYYDCLPTDTDPVPIGKPIYNTQMYVVDKYMNLQPVGVIGELCIAGVNVGQGYLNNPELTAEKFIDNPFGEGKLYKTGDLAFWREDGQLMFCGRMDNQIKLNGQRIEIGEIESVIGKIAGIEAVAVIVKKTGAADVLVAFYTGEPESEEVIKKLCSDKLPKYMVPFVYVYLDKMPLNQSGKLDRKMLDNYELNIAQPERNALPLNETEAYICECFKTVLSNSRIDRNTDFFEVGGSSITMISLLSEDRFENITAAEFMKNPTPAGVALAMREKSQTNFKYLESLYHSEHNNDKALILFPFAGGNAESYSRLLNDLKRRNDCFSVYFIRYLHSFEECESAAAEIAECLKDKRIFIYSHCVGSAVALQIISMLEQRDISVEKYFAAASIPPAKPTTKNFWRFVPDKVLSSLLSKEGAQLKGLSHREIEDMLVQFRCDTDFANISFASLRKKIAAPVSLIITKSDIFTYNYRQAVKVWENYAETVDNIHYIDAKTHYFQRDNSEYLVNFLMSDIL